MAIGLHSFTLYSKLCFGGLIFLMNAHIGLEKMWDVFFVFLIRIDLQKHS